MPTRGDITPRQREFGRRVAERRAELGYSQERLANEAHVERTYVAQLEAGRRNPSLETVCKLAVALGCDPGDLVAGLDAVEGRRAER